MPDRIPEISGAAIVVVGSFNPAIFQPEWFARQNLIPVPEADQAELKMVHPQLSHFETERFFIQVTTERFVAMTRATTDTSVLGDLVRGTFFILEHTPITAVGLDFQMHFSVGSEEAWHRVGDSLAPKEVWTEVLRGRPGMKVLQIEATDDNGHKMTIKVEPSIKITHGVYFETNEHYAVEGKKTGSAFLDELLRNRWEGAQDDATKIARSVLDWSLVDR